VALLGFSVEAELNAEEDLKTDHSIVKNTPIKKLVIPQNFDEWKLSFKQLALQNQIQSEVIDQALNGLMPDSKVLKLDASQPEFTRNIWDYLDNAISKQRLSKGSSLLKKHKNLFDKIEAEYGVQRETIVAIWAMESDFGRNYGSKSVIRSLATLAHHGKRAEFAQTELLEALRIIQDQKLNPKKLVGSWAGAMGQAQFMPSSYRKYSVDYDKDGKTDIWNSLPDVFASIANFLAESGWRKDEDWGVEVKLPNDFDWKLNTSSYELRFLQWKELAVNSINARPFPYIQRLASLFIPAGRFGPTFLVTHNFHVIKRYNNSSSYALGVAQLSRLLAGGESIQTAWPREDKALSYYDIEEIQLRLSLNGHDPGPNDGKMGAKTKEAIRTWQLEQGLAGDGYANEKLLQQLRENAKIDLNNGRN
jgi:membrane-bound lytic murein transglycosylase B